MRRLPRPLSAVKLSPLLRILLAERAAAAVEDCETAKIGYEELTGGAVKHNVRSRGCSERQPLAARGEAPPEWLRRSRPVVHEALTSWPYFDRAAAGLTVEFSIHVQPEWLLPEQLST